jgi:hypothetical protein
MRTLLALSAIVASTIAFSAPCDHVKGTGAVVKRTLKVAQFHGIDVQGAIDVVLTQGPSQSVEVEAQANLVDLVTVDVSKGIWTITTSKGYSTDKPFIVHITSPLIDQVEVHGSGDVKSESTFAADNARLGVEGSGDIVLAFTAKSVTADIQGSGDIKLSGSTQTLTASVEGSGDINAKNMAAETAAVSTAGSGDITVNATGSLSASIEGSGDILYRGRPANINRSVAGSGEVRALESMAR